MKFDTLLYGVDAGIAQITLNRPGALNALDPQLIGEFRTCLRQAAGDREVAAVVITGAGRGFCAGADLIAGFSQDGDPDNKPSPGEAIASAMETNFNPLVRDIAKFEKPTLAAVNGVSAGGGVGIALACDLVIAAKSAYFVQVFGPRLALVPDVGCTWFLPRLVGRARARGLALLGDRLPAERAEAWGLIWQCVEDDALMSTARALAQRLADGPTYALGQIKHILDHSEHNMLEDQLALERDFQRHLADRDEFSEGVAAFVEKRDPRF